MEHLLHNQLLYKNEVSGIEIYLTYEDANDSYGLFWQSGDEHKWSANKYVLVHPYESNRAAALRIKKGKSWWCWIDNNLNEEPMDLLDSIIIENLRIEDANCSCLGTLDFFDCKVCEFGIIENSYNFRKEVEDSNGNKLFTYSTKNAYYTISTLKYDYLQTLTADYVWYEDEMEIQLKKMIKAHEEGTTEIKASCIAFILKKNIDTTIKLIPYEIHIKTMPVSKHLKI